MLSIIQARSNSKRFKNKVLFKINEKPIIQHVVSNVKKSKYVSKIIVATSNKKIYNNLIDFLKKKKIKFFRGDLENVALRLYSAAKKNNSAFFVRISADSPLIDYKLINKAIKIFRQNRKIDLVTNIFPKTFPSGQSVEIVKTNILIQNLKFMSKSQKEHVTKFFYENNTKFLIKNFKCSSNSKYKNLKRMSVDFKTDIKKIKKYLDEN